MREFLERRRVLWIAPLAFAGLVAVSSRRGKSAPEAGGSVELVDYDENGRRVVTVERVVLREAEWKSRLSAQSFWVLRHGSTDTPFTGTYHSLHEAGLYRCAGCGTALFRSEEKFDSGTGWPSFRAPVDPRNIRTREDVSLFLERTEVSCARCGGHLGHVFPDGPAPTGLRYCINESALRFGVKKW